MYLAMRGEGSEAESGAGCDPCHAPLKDLLPAGDLVAAEGVNCDACHAIKDVVVEQTRSQITFALQENVKWGTICDARDQYFHKTACLPLYGESRLCAGCHRWSLPSSADSPPIAILTEYDEWLSSPAAAAGTTCQECHMPQAPAEVATGWKRLAPIGDHSLKIDPGGRWRGTITASLTAARRKGGVRAEVTITNAMRGHAAPTGFPGRQIVLRVSVLDTAGRIVERSERTYARVLVNAAGKEVPFTAARSEAADTRLAAGEVRRESFSFKGVDGPGAIAAELLWRRISPDIASALGLKLEEQRIHETRVALAPRRAAGHAP